jgi:pimeloyl-ACP methyl ester carboxylesterase
MTQLPFKATPKILAEWAQQRASRHEANVSGSVTRYWTYPAKRSSSDYSAAGQPAKTLILIHGYRGNHRGLEAIAGALDDFDLVIPDLPGFGESTPLTEEHTVANYAAWLDAFIAALKLEQPPLLLGHSFGSIIVAHAAAKGIPVEALILENPVSAMALKGPKRIGTKVAQGFYGVSARLPLKASERALKSWPMVRGMSILMAKTRDPQLRRWIHEQHDANFSAFANRDVVVQAFRASISECVGQWIEQFQVPTLMIAGELDDITSVRQQHEAFSRLRVPSSMIVHERVGHLTHYEIPDKVAEDIRGFVSGLNQPNNRRKNRPGESGATFGS